MCVCVCVCEREREREGGGVRGGKTEKNGQLNISVVADVCLCLHRVGDEGARMHERCTCVCVCVCVFANTG